MEKLAAVLVNEPLGKRLGLSELELIAATETVAGPAALQVMLIVVPLTAAVTGEPVPFNTVDSALAMSPGDALTGWPEQIGLVLTLVNATRIVPLAPETRDGRSSRCRPEVSR